MIRVIIANEKNEILTISVIKVITELRIIRLSDIILKKNITNAHKERIKIIILNETLGLCVGEKHLSFAYSFPFNVIIALLKQGPTDSSKCV